MCLSLSHCPIVLPNTEDSPAGVSYLNISPWQWTLDPKLNMPHISDQCHPSQYYQITSLSYHTKVQSAHSMYKGRYPIRCEDVYHKDGTDISVLIRSLVPFVLWAPLYHILWHLKHFSVQCIIICMKWSLYFPLFPHSAILLQTPPLLFAYYMHPVQPIY